MRRIALSLAVLGLAAAALAARQQAATPRWEYGQLTIFDMPGLTAVPVWAAGDSTAVLQWPKERDVVGGDFKPRSIPVQSSWVRTINQLGAAGWELLAVQGDNTTRVFYFKRPVSTP